MVHNIIICIPAETSGNDVNSEKPIVVENIFHPRIFDCFVKQNPWGCIVKFTRR